MSKIISVKEAVAMIPDGASIMVGGFMGCGNPHRIIDELSKSGKGNFKLICNDAPSPGPMGEEHYGWPNSYTTARLSILWRHTSA